MPWVGQRVGTDLLLLSEHLLVLHGQGLAVLLLLRQLVVDGAGDGAHAEASAADLVCVCGWGVVRALG